MSLRKNMSYAVSICGSCLGLPLRKLTGVNVSYPAVSFVSPGASIRTGDKGRISLGYRTAVRANTEISATGGEVLVGDRCFINRNCVVTAHERIEIGEGTTIGPGVCIYDHDHDGQGGYVTAPVKIGKNVWIGAGCTLLKGVEIGDNATIGAGSLITKDIPANSIAYNERRLVIREK